MVQHWGTMFKRTAPIQVWLTKRERERWRAGADASEMRLGEFVRLAVREALRKSEPLPQTECEIVHRKQNALRC
jgi:hypothetical protein